MPIQAPNLDDLTFDRTVEELLRRIPVYAPTWTDYNDSDPGISMIHLFAYLAEQIGYRLNRIPEKNHIELLKLLGIRLQPAHAAATRLALLLTNPSTLVGYTLAAGARAKAKTGTPPPVFETDAAVDVVPAEPILIVTTKNPYLNDVLRLPSGGYEQPATFPSVPNRDTEWLTVTWDGKAPKLKDMPIDPVPVRKRPAHTHLWIGLDFNAALDAGFRDVQVSLAIQFDDDERPDLSKDVLCQTPPPAGEQAVPVDWVWYFDAATADVGEVPGRIDDATAHLTRSGIVKFTVPATIGPIAVWHDMRPAPTVTAIDACLEMGNVMDAMLVPLAPLGTMSAGNYRTVLDAGIVAAKNKAAAAQPAVAHPLDPALRAPVAGWIRLDLPDASAQPTSPTKIRIVSFNTVPATNATTVTNELVGHGDGRPGQMVLLANQNILAGTLSLAVQEDSDPTTPLVPWTEVDSLDPAGPFDSVYELDREAGVVTFGDGAHGRIVPLVPQGGAIVALGYRYGGGKAGEVPAGAIAALDTGAPGIANAVNFVAATGGRDAETLDQAKERARKELSTRTRAVTAADFAWLAKQTPNVRVARAEIVPLRRPLAAGRVVPAPPPSPRCGPAIPSGALGLDETVAPGAVTVIVVPDEPGPEPTPTPSFLRAVCQQLDGVRLVTTEVHVVPPQFCRLCNVLIQVRGRPGFTRSDIQRGVEARLGTYLHVLTGGEDGTGFPFGAQLHIADLIAQVFRVAGVDRVEQLSADFTRTRSLAAPREGQLVLCPVQAAQVDRISLSAEENVSIDVTSIAVSTVA